MLDTVSSLGDWHVCIELASRYIEKMRGSKELRLAQSRELSSADWERLSLHPSSEVRAILGAHHRLPASIAERLGHDLVRQVVRAVAANPAAPASLIEQMYYHPQDEPVRAALLGNPALGFDQMEEVAWRGEPWERRDLAANPGIFDEVAVILRTDPEASVRGELARNPRVPKALLASMADDSDPFVRDRLASNPLVPSSAQWLLAMDHEPQVLRRLRDNQAVRRTVRRWARHTGSGRVVANGGAVQRKWRGVRRTWRFADKVARPEVVDSVRACDVVGWWEPSWVTQEGQRKWLIFSSGRRPTWGFVNV